MLVHVFIDNSNIYYGAQRAADTIEPEAPWLAVRVYYRNLFRLLEGQRNASTRVLAGSVPPGNDDLWRYAQIGGYDTKLLRKVHQDTGRLGEQAVDEMLHLKIANALLDHDPPQTLVLATGDGRETEFGGSFPKQILRALKRGWHVEVWSWKTQLSNEYRRLARDNVNCRVNELDDQYKSITFVKAGQYEIKGCSVSIGGRVVGKL